MNPSVAIFRATLADLDSVSDIERGSFGADAFSRRQLAYLIAKSAGAVYIARTDDGAAAGYISLFKSERTNVIRIYSIAVAPAARGLGIAARLVDKALEYTRENDRGAVFLEVRTDNEAAIGLYVKKGFAVRKRIPRYYPDGADAYSMALYLTQTHSNLK